MLSHSSKGEKTLPTTRECNIKTVAQAGGNKALERWRREWEREKFTGFPAAMADSNLCLHLSFPSSPLSSTPLSGWNTQIWTVTQSLTKEAKTLANNANLGNPTGSTWLAFFLGITNAKRSLLSTKALVPNAPGRSSAWWEDCAKKGPQHWRPLHLPLQPWQFPFWLVSIKHLHIKPEAKNKYI